MVWVISDIIQREFSSETRILEPCAGQGAISEELEYLGYAVIENDLFNNGLDYLTNEFNELAVITNPPFSL